MLPSPLTPIKANMQNITEPSFALEKIFKMYNFTEMQWLSVDFHEERQWKMAAAKMLAHSAKKYVEQQGERRAKRAAMLEKKHRRIAKFMADQVDLFWQSISRLVEYSVFLLLFRVLDNLA